jgi:perosamine synthetase
VEDVNEMSWYVFVVRLNDLYTARERDRIVSGMRRHEVGCSNYFPPIHLQPFYRERFGFKVGDLPVAEAVATRTIAMPFFTTMDPTQVELACLTLNVMIQREQLLRPKSGT